MAGFLMYSVVAFVTAAAGAATYLWYRKPSLILRLFISLGRKKVGLTVKYVTLKGGEVMCYAERGVPTPSQPSIVFVHGFSSSKDSWISLIQRLPRDIHVLAVDLIGHGDSSLPVTDHTPTAQYLTDGLHEFLEQVGIVKRPIHLIGISMGGLVSYMYTSAHPQNVQLLTTICPAVYTPVITEMRKEMRAGKNYLLPKTPEDMSELLGRILYYKDKIPHNKQLLKGFLQMNEGRSTFFQALSSSMVHYVTEEGCASRLSNITCPVHILWGANDELIHISGAEFMKSKLSNCQRVDILEQCGHVVTSDQPEKVTNSILEFRASVL